MNGFAKAIAYFALIGGVVLNSPAIAGTASGKVKALYVRSSDGLMYVTLDSPSSGQPSCATGDYFVIKDEKSDTGKAQFAMLTAAYLNGTTVVIQGSGTCTRWPDGEDINVLMYHN